MFRINIIQRQRSAIYVLDRAHFYRIFKDFLQFLFIELCSAQLCLQINANKSTLSLYAMYMYMYMSLHFSLSFHIFVDEFSSPSLFRLSFAIHHANPFRKIMQTFDGRHKITSVDIELIVISFELAYIYQTRYCQC